MKKALVALLVSGMMSSAFAGVVIDEGFDDVSSLQSKGWSQQNNSTPVGVTNWFQGNVDITAQSGAPTSYISANFGSAAPGGAIDNWLYTPEFSTALGATVSFWLTGAAFEDFTDSISFGFVDAAGALINFVPSFVVGTNGWTQYTANIGASAGTARFAFNYTGNEATSNAVGIDTLSIATPDVAEVPEPASILILAAGAMGLVAARRRKRA